MKSGSVIWTGVCAVAAWNVERYTMWNEAECGLRHGAIRGSGGGFMRDVLSGGIVEYGGVLMCDVECQCENGSGMWNWV